MKKLSFVFLFAMSIFVSKAQTVTSETEAMQMLRNFYTSYSSLEYTIKDYPKMQLLQKQYCSKRLIKILKDEFKANGLDHDLLTNDYGIDSTAAKTVSIIKMPNKANGYIVSYMIFTTDPSYKPIIKKVIIHVTVVKENGSLKLASTDWA